jgi:hypothetical protein
LLSIHFSGSVCAPSLQQWLPFIHQTKKVKTGILLLFLHALQKKNNNKFWDLRGGEYSIEKVSENSIRRLKNL